MGQIRSGRVESAPSVDPSRNALHLILDQTSGRCEHNVDAGIGACFTAGRTADAKYGIDLACTSCIAHAALNDLPIPLGPGRDAIAETHASPAGA